MLVYDDGEGMVCIGQAAHSWVSGRLARRWGNDAFAAPSPLAEVCLGAEQHDIGMAEWDRRPELDADTGYPVHFTDLPVATHLALWTEAPERILSQSPYAALLVSMHGHALFAKRRPTPEIERYMREQERLQADLRDRIGAGAEEARRNQRLVWALDYLALVGLIPEWGGRTQEAGITGDAPDARVVTVDPWPFADGGAFTLAYPGRRLTEPSSTTQELHARLAAAPWVDVPVTWRPK